MSFIDKIRKLSGETEKQRKQTEHERRNRRLESISEQCRMNAEKVAEDVERDARGEGQWKGHVSGFVVYHFQDEDGRYLRIDKFLDDVRADDILATSGFQTLRERCQELGLSVELTEEIDMDADAEEVITNYIIEVRGWK